MIWLALSFRLLSAYGQQPRHTSPEDDNFDRVSSSSSSEEAEAATILRNSNEQFGARVARRLPDGDDAAEAAVSSLEEDGGGRSSSSGEQEREARWRRMYSDNWHERVSISEPESPRLPRRVDASNAYKMEFFNTQDALQVLPREIKVDQVPSTPHLNSIMDRALGKVKNLLKELEQERGKTEQTLFASLEKLKLSNCGPEVIERGN